VDPYEGFNEFVMARTGALSRTAYLLTGDHHLAEDLLQVALSRVASRWPEVRGGRPEAYVRRVLVNEFLSWRRRRRYHEQPVAEPEPASVRPDVASAVVRRMLIGQALARLSPRQRAVVVLRYFDDLTEADAAEVLGCAIGTVKSQTHNALARLRAVAPELAELSAQPQRLDGVSS
jgi:RNA polymerase sigma-70 factor (sigma-E family)